MDKTYIRNWAKAAGVRALRTFAQAALAIIGTAVMLSDVNWGVLASTSALAAILSLLTSVVTGLPEVKGDKHNER